MDLESKKQQFVTCLRKYRFAALILLLGLLIMLIPEKQTLQQVTLPEAKAQPTLQEQLEIILGQISGVGKVQVLLTEASGSNTIYQTNSGQNASSMNTVILTDGNRTETGLVKQILPPVYRGAVVVCRGADSAAVRLAVVEAVKSVTGLSSDCITVVKMK